MTDSENPPNHLHELSSESEHCDRPDASGSPFLRCQATRVDAVPAHYKALVLNLHAIALVEEMDSGKALVVMKTAYSEYSELNETVVTLNDRYLTDLSYDELATRLINLTVPS